jgi:hypothetical protein
VNSAAGVDSMEAALAADGDNMKSHREAKFIKEFISQTTFLSFPGSTGESRKTPDARLRLSSQGSQRGSFEHDIQGYCMNITKRSYE